MDAKMELQRNATLSYFERHIHGPRGGVTIVPKTVVYLDEGARYSTEFELIQGAAGVVELDYQGFCERDAVLDMKARLYGRLEDRIHIREAVQSRAKMPWGSSQVTLP